MLGSDCAPPFLVPGELEVSEVRRTGTSAAIVLCHRLPRPMYHRDPLVDGPPDRLAPVAIVGVDPAEADRYVLALADGKTLSVSIVVKEQPQTEV